MEKRGSFVNPICKKENMTLKKSDKMMRGSRKRILEKAKHYFLCLKSVNWIKN